MKNKLSIKLYSPLTWGGFCPVMISVLIRKMYHMSLCWGKKNTKVFSMLIFFYFSPIIPWLSKFLLLNYIICIRVFFSVFLPSKLNLIVFIKISSHPSKERNLSISEKQNMAQRAKLN